MSTANQIQKMTREGETTAVSLVADASKQI